MLEHWQTIAICVAGNSNPAGAGVPALPVVCAPGTDRASVPVETVAFCLLEGAAVELRCRGHRRAALPREPEVPVAVLAEQLRVLLPAPVQGNRSAAWIRGWLCRRALDIRPGHVAARAVLRDPLRHRGELCPELAAASAEGVLEVVPAVRL
ncbi:hypothetical protein PMKS-002916 [Pichia membranifaciens]|uniref:Uncharacterized protein n=1 Tax=Pichia membranifaciens TaxID=4926 RepID=A0A1Q2YIN5_9ASCO|nr:hypothetical protein PMKS-002916 [Pichia membranifaciens]